MKASGYKALYSLEGLSPKSLTVTCCQGWTTGDFAFCTISKLVLFVLQWACVS